MRWWQPHHYGSVQISHLEKDKTAEPQRLCLHRTIKVAFPPEVKGREDVSKPNQPTPHTMTPLHIEDELELWKSHVMVHTRKNKIKHINHIIWVHLTSTSKVKAYILNSGKFWYLENSASHSACDWGGFISLTRCQSTMESPDSVSLMERISHFRWEKP